MPDIKWYGCEFQPPIDKENCFKGMSFQSVDVLVAYETKSGTREVATGFLCYTIEEDDAYAYLKWCMTGPDSREIDNPICWAFLPDPPEDKDIISECEFKQVPIPLASQQRKKENKNHA